MPNRSGFPEAFPGYADDGELKAALAKRLDPPRQMSPAATKRWRQKAMERDADVYVQNLMLLGMHKHPDPIYLEAIAAARSNALVSLKDAPAKADPLYEQVTKGGGLVSAQCERFDFRPLDVVEGVNFDAANLRASEWSDLTVRNCRFANADLSRASLHRTHFAGCDFTMADLSGAYLRGALFENCKFPAAVLRWARAKNSIWVHSDLRQLDVAFTDFLGARFWKCQTEGVRHAETAVFVWYRATDGSGDIQFIPTPGYVISTESKLGSESYQENAARRGIDL